MFNEHLLTSMAQKLDVIATDVGEMKGDIKVLNSQIGGEGGILDTQRRHNEDIETVKKFQWKITGALVVLGGIGGWIVKKFETLTK